MGRSRSDGRRWQELLAKQARSGLSLRAFAAREGVSPNTLAYWKYKRGAERKGSPALVPVRVIDDERPRGGELVIEFASARLRVGSGCDLDLLARVIAILRESC